MSPRAYAAVLLGAALAGPLAVSAQPVVDLPPRPLPLEEAVRLALRHNLDLLVARTDLRIAEADVLSARAPLDGSFSLSARHSATDTDVVDGAPGSLRQGITSLTAGYTEVFPYSGGLGLSVTGSLASEDPFLTSANPFDDTYSSEVALEYTQPLLRGFGRTATYGRVEVAEHVSDAARLRYRRSVEEAVATVERTYWTLALAEETDSVSRASVATAAAVHDRNVGLFRRGLATELDTITSARALALREVAALRDGRRLQDAREALVFVMYGEEARRALAEGAWAVTTVDEAPAVPESLALDDARGLALSRRADLAAARRQMAGSEVFVDVASNELKPALDLTASVGSGGIAPRFRFLSYPDSLAQSSVQWTVGASFTLPRRNVRAEGAMARAEAALDADRYVLAAVENRVVADVRSAVRAVDVGIRSLARARDAGLLAEIQYEKAEQSARLGLITTFDLLLYEEDLVEARLAEATAEFELHDALTRYRLAVGTVEERYDLAGAAAR